MRAVVAGILIASVAGGTAALAKPSGVGQLNQALAVVAASAVDRDQGDDHASPVAILKVCSKDNPAAQRSAICPIGISPD